MGGKLTRDGGLAGRLIISTVSVGGKSWVVFYLLSGVVSELIASSKSSILITGGVSLFSPIPFKT